MKDPMKVIDIFIDRETNKNKGFIVFKFENGHEYDPDLCDTKQEWWMTHMRCKNWFTKSVEEKTLKLLNSL